MLFAIDIDQTLATGFIGLTIKESIEHYQQLGVAIPVTVSTYLSLFQMPEVMKLHETLPRAAEGVTRLTELGTIRYFTVRKNDDNALNGCIQAITKQWLAEKQFPCPYEVLFCHSTLHKLVRMHELAKDTQESFVFIDDQWHKVLDALDLLEARGEDGQLLANFVRKQVTIVAFGADQVPERNDICLVALPSWAHIANLQIAVNIGQDG
jgi:hypothetical protein